jgi:hypothetical protein
MVGGGLRAGCLRAHKSREGPEAEGVTERQAMEILEEDAGASRFGSWTLGPRS